MNDLYAELCDTLKQNAVDLVEVTHTFGTHSTATKAAIEALNETLTELEILLLGGNTVQLHLIDSNAVAA